MSTRRKTKAPFASQKGRCSWCGTTDIPKSRRSWCSEKCVHEYRMRSDPGYVRQLIHKRDKGICALCGCDADTEYRKHREARKEVQRLTDRLLEGGRWHQVWRNSRWEWKSDPHAIDWKERARFRDYMREKYSPPGSWTVGRKSGWDADHIIPVCEGGGECDLSNYRTLCHPCHKRVTAELARRRASARSGQPELF